MLGHEIPRRKRQVLPALINLMPPHQTYIESHLGGGAVMRNKKAAQRNIGLDLDAQVIELWQSKLSGTCELHQVDAVSFLEGYAFEGEELVYVDPPYVPETRRREKVYRCDYTEADHIRLLRCLVELPCNVMLSGYDCDLYNQELVGWRKVSFPAKTHVEMREEVVWMNFSPLVDCTTPDTWARPSGIARPFSAAKPDFALVSRTWIPSSGTNY